MPSAVGSKSGSWLYVATISRQGKFNKCGPKTSNLESTSLREAADGLSLLWHLRWFILGNSKLGGLCVRPNSHCIVVYIRLFLKNTTNVKLEMEEYGLFKTIRVFSCVTNTTPIYFLNQHFVGVNNSNEIGYGCCMVWTESSTVFMQKIHNVWSWEIKSHTHPQVCVTLSAAGNRPQN